MDVLPPVSDVPSGVGNVDVSTAPSTGDGSKGKHISTLLFVYVATAAVAIIIIATIIVVTYCRIR